jgi:hypothetical protein
VNADAQHGHCGVTFAVTSRADHYRSISSMQRHVFNLVNGQSLNMR